MRYLTLIAIVCGLVSACAIRSERTVVERPVAAPATAAVVYADPVPTVSTVYVGP